MQLAEVADYLLTRSAPADDGSGCRRWLLAHDRNGYGACHVRIGAERFWAPHQLAYRVWRGLLPDGHEIDHCAARGCRWRDCIEPSHLEAVTRRENTLRSESFAGRYARQTTCKRGHPFTPENTMRTSTGSRRCRTCNAETQRRYRQRRAS